MGGRGIRPVIMTVLVVLAAVLGTLGAVPATAVPAGGVPAVPALRWVPCAKGFQCATATVPLDYARPGGATVHLAVIRHPATDPAHRIGSVFFNPGGPGGSGVASLPPIYAHFPAQLRARFDVVSFDPRGIGGSTPLQCFDTVAAEQHHLAGLPAVFPATLPDQLRWIARYSGFDRHCAQRAGALLAHDTTADVARDMDLLRQAVGDSSMNYLGVS